MELRGNEGKTTAPSTCTGEAEEGGTAVAAQGPAGLSLDEQLGLNIGLLQPQLWPTPILNQLPVLNIDKDDDEPATVCQVKEKCIICCDNRPCSESRKGLWRSRAVRAVLVLVRFWLPRELGTTSTPLYLTSAAQSCVPCSQAPSWPHLMHLP